MVDDRTLALTALVTVPGYKAKRFTEEQVTEAVRPLRERLEALQAEVDALRART